MRNHGKQPDKDAKVVGSFIGGGFGAALGAAIGGPVGAAVGAALGALFTHWAAEEAAKKGL
jgi:outer membrane lipoprotein SlyB